MSYDSELAQHAAALDRPRVQCLPEKSEVIVLQVLSRADLAARADSGAELRAAPFDPLLPALAGVLVLGVGSAATDLGAELAGALVAEQWAALAGLPSAGRGWISGRPAHRDALANLLAPAFVAHTESVGQNDILPYADALAHLESWPSPIFDPTPLVKKDFGYWNPFT